MQAVKNMVLGKALGVAEYLTPVLRESKFRETGVLTPDEFVASGDHLVYQFPMWQWESGEEAKLRPYLPKDKQFLINRNVPCYKRVKQIDNHSENFEKIVEEGDADGGWVDTHHWFDPSQLCESVTDMVIEDKDKKPCDRPLTTEDDDDDSDDEPALDIEECMAQLDAEDPAAVSMETAYKEVAAAAAAAAGATATDSDIIQTRTYDLHITYDKYYQTPRLWIFGYNEDRKPLTVKEMYEDVSSDHANKTVTMEAHPHLSVGLMACIHPCRHAEVIKKLIEIIAEGGNEFGVHEYLMIFLKFVQAAIPTIEYDYTRTLNLG